MSRLEPDYTPAFSRDVKRIAKQHVDVGPLEAIIEFVCQNDSEALDELFFARKNFRNSRLISFGFNGLGKGAAFFLPNLPTCPS